VALRGRGGGRGRGKVDRGRVREGELAERMQLKRGKAGERR
jgi:hypothetical protein